MRGKLSNNNQIRSTGKGRLWKREKREGKVCTFRMCQKKEEIHSRLHYSSRLVCVCVRFHEDLGKILNPYCTEVNKGRPGFGG